MDVPNGHMSVSPWAHKYVLGDEMAREEVLMDSTQRWQVIEEECRACGVTLFDIEMQANVLRVYIYKTTPQSSKEDGNSEDGGKGITVDDCARVSHRITDHPQADELIPGEMLLEVSSPGVNRKLSRPQHFVGAVGERVRVKFTPEGEPTRVVRGKVENAKEEAFQLLDEEQGAALMVPYSSVKEARIDFRFD